MRAQIVPRRLEYVRPPAADLLSEAREYERAGRVSDAVERYREAITTAIEDRSSRVLSEALRRLAVLRYHRNDPDEAQALCDRSYTIASAHGDDVLAAEALNTLANVHLQTGDLEEAGATYGRALALGGHDRELRARVEQNLGVLANIHGDLDRAQAHYLSSLEAYESTGNEQGCAIAFHNLGMVNADRECWDDADRFYTRSRTIAERIGDLRLVGLCRVNHAEVHVAGGRYAQARTDAETAMEIFDRFGWPPGKAEAYRMIGVAYREEGRLVLAESRLRTAMDLASEAGAVLSEAEAARELAGLYRTMGRNQEALSLLNTAYRLFDRLDARVDLINVRGKVESLEATYLALVREWGRSIESSDSYTFGHCERVADHAVTVGRALGLDDVELKAIRIGAYLHDLGKVRIPHEILNKPGRLTDEEYEIVKRHTIWGVELLTGIEFPWEIKSIIRSHHERYDGTGYPDALQGDEIPIAAQVIGIADVYDALTTTRAYRGAMSHTEAMAEIVRCRTWWHPDVLDAFHRALAAQEAAEAPAA